MMDTSGSDDPYQLINVALANPDRHVLPPVIFLFQESLLHSSIPLRRKVSVRTSLHGLHRLVWICILRRCDDVGFLAGVPYDGSFVTNIVNRNGFIQACCPSGSVVHEGSCYSFSQQNASFLDAEDHCVRKHGHLVNIGSQSENTFLQSFSRSLKDKDYLIGLNDLVREGEWQWYDTDVMAALIDWAPGQPGVALTRNCVIMSSTSDFHWEDVSCSQPYNYICEIPMEISNEIIG